MKAVTLWSSATAFCTCPLRNFYLSVCLFAVLSLSVHLSLSLPHTRTLSLSHHQGALCLSDCLKHLRVTSSQSSGKIHHQGARSYGAPIIPSLTSADACRSGLTPHL